jgi:hypothetical protein
MLWVGCAKDEEAPVVWITFPSHGADVSGIVNITAEAVDNKKVEKVEFYINGGHVSTSTSRPYFYSWTTTILPNDSSHTIFAKAYDEAGNVGISSMITVKVDNRP